MTHFLKKQFQSNLMIKVLNNLSNTAQKMKFSITLIEEMLNGKLHFLCSATHEYQFKVFIKTLD